jgi:hypothetical protein
MDVNKRTLEKIFDPTEQLEAPLFQRPYVWKQEKNWQPLWDSVQIIADKRLAGVNVHPHFLGTIVLDQLRNPTGTITARQIIDGQQRLTTLQLALAAIRDICRAVSKDPNDKVAQYQKTFAKLTHNDVPLSDDPDDIFKVYPTNADRAHFRACMNADSAEDVRKIIKAEGDGEALIPGAYLYFYDTISSWLGPPDDEEFTKRLKVLYQVIKDDLNLVVIDLDEKDDAQVIFETLNALGTPLLPADLVKNFLFHAAEHEGLDTESLYNRFWEPFDKYRKFWRAEVTQGRFKRPRLDLFLQNYLTLVTGEDVPATQLFTTFRDHVQKSARSTSEHLEQFRSYAKVYRDFRRFPEDSPEGVFFYRLEQLDTTTVYPLLLEVFSAENLENNRDDVLQVCRVLESYFVRRTVCELSTRGYARVFLDLIKKLSESDDFSAKAISNALLEHTADFSKFPTDGEFEQAWNRIPIYKKLAQKKTRMILEALNDAMHTDKTEKVKKVGRFTLMPVKATLTIEHIMPQQWQHHWQPKNRTLTEQEVAHRNYMIHTIGNLTLLTKKLNPAISNGSWATKKAEILKHSAINLNRPFLNIDLWDEDTIRDRTRGLFKIAVNIWPRPVTSTL